MELRELIKKEKMYIYIEGKEPVARKSKSLAEMGVKDGDNLIVTTEMKLPLHEFSEDDDIDDPGMFPSPDDGFDQDDDQKPYPTLPDAHLPPSLPDHQTLLPQISATADLLAQKPHDDKLGCSQKMGGMPMGQGALARAGYNSKPDPKKRKPTPNGEKKPSQPKSGSQKKHKEIVYSKLYII
jgi:hypothetical protein